MCDSHCPRCRHPTVTNDADLGRPVCTECGLPQSEFNAWSTSRARFYWRRDLVLYAVLGGIPIGVTAWVHASRIEDRVLLILMMLAGIFPVWLYRCWKRNSISSRHQVAGFIWLVGSVAGIGISFWLPPRFGYPHIMIGLILAPLVILFCGLIPAMLYRSVYSDDPDHGGAPEPES